jgi:hypothetical protein
MAEIKAVQSDLELNLKTLDILNAELVDVERGYKRTEELFLKHYKSAIKKDIYMREFDVRNLRRCLKSLNEELACLNLSLEEISKLPMDVRKRIEQVVILVPTDDLIVH